MQEDCDVAETLGDGSPSQITIPPGLRRGDNARARGEDICVGATVLTAGHRLRPQDIGVAASLGLTTLSVYRPLRVAVFSTGDEVHDPGTDLPPGGIYDANRYCLLSLLQGLGCQTTDLGILPDTAMTILTALSNAAPQQDLILSSGGVSVGDEDHVRQVISQLGGITFWRLNIKPGRPVGMGEIGTTPFIGLPGNPAAMMVTFLRIARPAILALGGASYAPPTMFRVTSSFDHKKKAGRREYLRARLVSAPATMPVAEKFSRSGAGILTSFVDADGLVELPETVTHLKAGEPVDFLPFSELL